MKRNLALLGLFVVLVIVALTLLGATSLAPPPPGNNGTVKIHNGDTEDEPIINNEPHVCSFHVHFFFADPFQSGSWVIKSWPPTGNGTVVLPLSPPGTYNTDPSGEYRTILYNLPNGHYRLEWQGRNEQNVKHKEFWVKCPVTPTPTNTRRPDPTKTPTLTPIPPTLTPVPTAINTPVPTNTPIVTNTPVPGATDTPVPTDTPAPKQTKTPGGPGDLPAAAGIVVLVLIVLATLLTKPKAAA